MNHSTHRTNTSQKLGFWSALIIGALFVVYTVCFIGILGGGPMFQWTNMEAFIQYTSSHNQTLKYTAYAGMMVLGIAYVVLTQCVYENTTAKGRLFAHLGGAFGIMFALCSGLNYFVQLVTVRLMLMNGFTDGLEQFIMGNPISAIAAVNMLGWSFLFGLSSLSVSLALWDVPAAKTARWCLAANAAVCITDGIGFVMNNKLLIGLCMYPLMGGTVTAMAISLAVMFLRMVNCDSNHGHSDNTDYNRM